MESFSSKIKEELSELNNLSNKSIVKSELYGYLKTGTSNEFVTESKHNINRFGKLLSNIGQEDYSIEIQGNKFIIKTKKKIDFEEDIKSEEEYKAMIRGCFMATGSINNPENSYHLEIVFDNKINAEDVLEKLKDFEIKSNIIERDKKFVIYIKDGDEISNFLALIGANKSVLEFEQTRVVKDVRNKVNRLVNCETANLNKTINASVRQVEDIKYIKKRHKFNSLTPKDRDIANLRLEFPNATYAELAKKTNPEIGKSGVNHRLTNISKFADELRNE